MHLPLPLKQAIVFCVLFMQLVLRLLLLDQIYYISGKLDQQLMAHGQILLDQMQVH